MKPTPRTDAMIYPSGARDIVTGEPIDVVHADDARDLERQLSDALEREKALRLELAIEFGNSDRLAKALGALITGAELEFDTRRCHESSLLALNQARIALALHNSGDEPTYTDCPIHGRHEGDCPRC